MPLRPARFWASPPPPPQVLECVYERLLPLVDGFNSLVQLHLLLLGTQALVHHPAAVVRITAHLHGQLAHIRLKVRRGHSRSRSVGVTANTRLNFSQESWLNLLLELCLIAIYHSSLAICHT